MAPLESLSPELLDMILPHLDWPDIARLARCKATLCKTLEETFYGDKEGVSDRPEDSLPLVPIILADAPLDLVRQFLDRGANPNYNKPYPEWKPSSPQYPLCAAIMANSVDIFNLLLSRGANIHNDSELINVPVFAAARAMATTKNGLAMMQLCLDNGGDLTSRVATNSSYTDRSYCKTPLLVYLDSIADWEKLNPDFIRPIEALEYFAKRGATVGEDRLFRRKCVEGNSVLGPAHGYERDCEDLEYVTIYSESCIEFLLRKWGTAHIAHPEFFSVVKFLLEHGDVGDRVESILSARCRDFDIRRQPSQKLTPEEIEASRVRVYSAWTNFLSLLFPQSHPDEPWNLHALLRDVIVMSPRVCIDFEDTTHASVDFFRDRGANINFTDVGKHGTQTPLHAVGTLYQKWGYDVYKDMYKCSFEDWCQKRMDWVRFLKASDAEVVLNGECKEKDCWCSRDDWGLRL